MVLHHLIFTGYAYTHCSMRLVPVSLVWWWSHFVGVRHTSTVLSHAGFTGWTGYSSSLRGPPLQFIKAQAHEAMIFAVAVLLAFLADFLCHQTSY